MKSLLFLPAILLFLSTGRLRADAVVVFNEIMYHPVTNEALFEFVELRNLLAVDVDISDWSISGMIDFTFPSNSIIKGNSHLLLARSPSTMMGVIGSTNVYGPFLNRLENDGGELRLRNNSGRVMDEVNYDTEGDWPVAPDGSGVSLAKRNPESASGPAANWTSSEQIGGTPGARNFAPTTGFTAPPGLISYWNFNEPSGSSIGDQAGANPGTLGSGVSRLNSTVGRALSFDGSTNAFANVGAGASFAVSTGITIEALLTPGWSTTNSAVIFRKAPRRPRAYTDTVMDNNPLAYWRLNDANTTILDTTVNVRNGTATAGVVLNQPGLIASDPANNAMRFTGAERVTVNGFEKIGPTGYTVEFWVRPTALPTGCCQNLVGDGEAAGDYFMMNYILGPQQGLVGAIRPHYGPGNSPVSLTGGTALQINNTYHIVTTWNTGLASDNAIIYINGVVSSVGTITRNVPAAGTTGNNRVYLGKDDRDTTDGTEILDEVALYNYPLTATDVGAHYAAGITTNFDQTLGNAIQLAFQDDGNNAAANPPVAPGKVLSFGLTVGGVYSELDMPLDGASGRPTLAALENGQPHHVAATYDSATGVKAIYIDGALRFSTTLSGALNAANGANAILGNSEANGSAPFVGALDEMTYWSRALTASEVSNHYAAVLAGRDYFTSPSQAAPASLAFNELGSLTSPPFWLEIINYGTNPISLAGYVIYRDSATNQDYVFPAGPPLGGGARLSVLAGTLGFTPVSGDKLYLLTPTRDRVLDSVVVKTRGRARTPEGTGAWLFPNVPTPGGANTFALHDELVINEIMYNHAPLPGTNNLPPRESSEAWVEIFNKSSNTVDLTDWELEGGIHYRFTPGKTLGPGAYVVVANDAPALRLLYPSIDIVGNFTRRLSGKSDRIVLEDPADNPADEVRYFDGGRWPDYADGGGSSLELRDPNADNSKAEAWAASDETGKTQWQTNSYRLIANIPSGSGQPTTWQDFIIGLQAAGECLIDDLSVIENPATTPLQVIANGDFQSGLSGWRTLGTHNRSRVEQEPGNPGNSVLHLIATGPQEHMHNHIERTLTAGRTIVNGREYQISFRARWLAGNNLFNARLYFSRAGRTTALPMAPLNGTPGAQNSRLAGNIGPTFSEFGHQHVVPLPGEPVTVSVLAQDPQSVASAQVFWSVNSGAWNNAAMTAAGGGRYTGVIPGQNAAAVVQFYVQATDGLGAVATFPARAAESGALYKVEDGQSLLSLSHNVRLILTTSNIDLMHGTAQGVNQTNVMSNDLLPCTVIYDEARVYYDCGVHLRGSQRGRYSDVRTGFHIEFPPDDLFRGVHPVMLVDRSGAGDATANRQEEIVLKHILNRAGGLPGTYGEIARVIAPRSAHTGPCQFFPRHEDNFIETAFPDGGDGTMFEMELIYYPTSANAAGYKLPQPDAVIGTDITNLGDDKEFYRYNFMLKNHRDTDDYSRFIALGKAWSLTGAALDAQTRQLMDLDQWMRAYALVSLCSVGDMYTFGNNHNFFMYQRASDGKFLYFPWDMDFAFTRGSGGALVGDQNLGKLVNLPSNLRRMYAHMLDIINVSFNSSYMTYWTDHYDNFAPGQSYAGSLSTIGARVPFVQTAINNAGGNAPFAVSGPANITISSNLVTLSGTAPVMVKTIRINGREYAVTWSTVSGWTIRVPVSDAFTVLNVEAYDIHGNLIPNLTRTVNVTYTGPALDPTGQVVINEIMYNSAVPDGAYLELFDRSTTHSFDLSGWRLNGLDYTFPPGSVITSRQYLVLASSIAGYGIAYPTNGAPFDQFHGNLQNNGETITLFRPGTVPDEEIVVDKVRYESILPWPVSVNGTGASLELVDAAQDNSRVSSWRDPRVWRQARITGNMGGSTNNLKLYMFIDTPGEVFIDDIYLVEGTNAEAGVNLIQNGNFDSTLSPPWVVSGTNAGSVIVTEPAHSGMSTLRLVSGSIGSASTTRSIYQDVVGAITNTIYTLSFWYLPTTSANVLTVRTAPGSLLILSPNVRPVLASPGAANIVARPRPPYDAVWLNEIQTTNVNGIADSQGEREPWVELYNAGMVPVSLTGYYLSDNYSNLTKWAFPEGATLQPGEFKLVFVDGETGESTATEWHTSFRLSTAVGSVALSWTPSGEIPEVLDYFNYPTLPAGRSYGAYPDGQPFTRQEFYVVTPGSTNNNTAVPLVVFINEWAAANSTILLNTNHNNTYDDWFELYNPGNNPADLGGYFLTDNLSNKSKFEIPSGFVIPPHGYKLVWADEASELNNTNNPDLHVNFKLDQQGEQIGLFGSDGVQIDAITFGPQYADISEGRYPDGPGAQWVAPLTVPTPRAPNALYANRYPVLASIPDTTAYVNLPFQFTAAATDPDSPPQSLLFTLQGNPPTNATVAPLTGQFSWTPTASQADTTNVITLRVTDNGTPVLRAEQTFTVVVRAAVVLGGVTTGPGDTISFKVLTTPGKTYRVEYKNALTDTMWTPIPPDHPANGTILTISDTITADPQRFYRVVELE